MHKLFSAQSVVVVGVSESEDNLGKNIVSNLVRFGYRGTIHAVGPRGGEVLGRAIYHTVSDIPEPVDLAVILTPARFIPEIMRQCGEKGISRAVVESAGFGELGAEGEELERQVVEICTRFGIRFVGPNCIGVIHTKTGLYTPFVALPTPYRQGKASVFAQSGGVGLTLGERLSSSGIGVNKLVSMGNKLNLDEADFLRFLLDDSDTEIIFFYLEDFKRGREFVEAARGSSKPIILIKSYTSPLSQSIAESHTGALAGDDAVVDAVCSEAGIVRVDSVAEAVNAARSFSMPPLRGNNLAIVSRSGGHAVVAADACARHGFQLPPFDERLLETVRERLRAGVVRLGNPMDLGDLYDMPFNFKVVESVLSQDNIHGAIFIHVSHMAIEREASRRLLQDLWDLSWRCAKPVAIVVEIPFEERVFLLETSDFPFFSEPVEAVEALALQWKHAKSEAARACEAAATTVLDPDMKVSDWLRTFEAENRQPLLHEALELMDRISIPTAPWKFTRTLSDALEAAEAMGYPVALKAVGRSLLHKSEKGGVVLNIRGMEELEIHWRGLSDLAPDVAGVVVQKMVSSSRELIIGGKRDPSFGPVVLTGLGGIMVEVLKDVRMRLAPVGVDAAMHMLRELSGARILGPFRGMPKADIEAASRILENVSKLMHQFPQISELDLNPVSLNDDGKGALALDARLLLRLG
jgi:acetyltransferase